MTRLLLCTSFLALACACPDTEWAAEPPSDEVAVTLTVCLDPSLSANGRGLMRTASREWDLALGGLTLALRDAPVGSEGCDIYVDERHEVEPHHGPGVAGYAHTRGDITPWSRVTFYTGRYEYCYRAALHELGHVFGLGHADHGLMAPSGDDCGHVDRDAAAGAAETLGLAEYSWRVLAD